MSSIFEIQALRSAIWLNQFRPVPVETGGKRVFQKEWPELARANPPFAATAWPESETMNTGILCDGLVAIDIDVDDATVATKVHFAAWEHLGAAPRRVRANSSRSLIVYRASEGKPTKLSVAGLMGKVEALGRGQQFVAYGTHQSGSTYEWIDGLGPAQFAVGTIPAVTQESVLSFLRAVAPLVGDEKPVQATKRPTSLSVSSLASARDLAYGGTVLEAEIAVLRELGPGDGRNAAVNQAAFALGTLAGNGSLDRTAAAQALYDAATANGHLAKHGESQTWATINSGLNSGIAKPRPHLTVDAPDIDVRPMVENMIAAYKAKHSAKPSSPLSKRSIIVTQGSAIEAKPITWLWDGYLPSGKLTLLAGAGGTGKSTIAFSLAGTITKGGSWPDNTRCNAPSNVLIWSSEDDPADTIKPRLMAVGADQTRYGVISGTTDENGLSCPFDAAVDMDGLRDAVKRIGGVSLLIIDPIVTAVTGDMHKANDVRRSLQAIVDFAAECECAVLGITLFAKGTAGKNSAERVIGSQAFAALARMVLVAAKEEDSDRRVFTRAKSNNSVDTGGFSYSIEALTLDKEIVATRVVWGEALEGSSRSILAEVEGEQTEDTTKRGQAKRFLIESLRNGPVPSKELFEEALERHSISKDTLRRAQSDLGITAIKAHFNGGWSWSLPFQGSDPATAR